MRIAPHRLWTIAAALPLSARLASATTSTVGLATHPHTNAHSHAAHALAQARSIIANRVRTFSMGTAQGKQAQDFSKGKSESEWRAQLSPAQFRILREKGTEPAGTGEYDKHYEQGTYNCAGCNTPLYKSATKFKSGCGWPAFYDAIPGAIDRHVDSTFGMKRIEITCSACGGHLGHVFQGEGFQTPTDERHCVNSVSLSFNDEDK